MNKGAGALACLLSICTFVSGQAKNNSYVWLKTHPEVEQVNPALAPAAVEYENLVKDVKFMRKIGDSSENSVALLKIESDGSIELNPRIKGKYLEFEYVNIPDLGHMKIEDCEHLWGASTGKNSEFQSFTLESIGHGKLEATYTVDTIFQKNELKKYRIRKSDDNGGFWRSVSRD